MDIKIEIVFKGHILRMTPEERDELYESLKAAGAGENDVPPIQISPYEPYRSPPFGPSQDSTGGYWYAGPTNASYVTPSLDVQYTPSLDVQLKEALSA